MGEREKERVCEREGAGAPIPIGDGSTTRVLNACVFLFLVCASPPLLFLSGPLAVADLCHHAPEKHFLIPRAARAGNGAEP